MRINISHIFQFLIRRISKHCSLHLHDTQLLIHKRQVAAMSASAKKKATTDNVPAIPFRTVGLGRIEAVRFGKHLCDNCSFVPVVSVRDLEILAKSQPVGKDIDVHMDNLMFRLWYIKEKLLPDLASAIEVEIFKLKYQHKYFNLNIHVTLNLWALVGF